jgi:hypothetical protein
MVFLPSAIFTIHSIPLQQTAYGMADSVFDKRIGLRYYRGATNISGLRPALAGQQVSMKMESTKTEKEILSLYTSKLLLDRLKQEMIGNSRHTCVKYIPDYAFTVALLATTDDFPLCRCGADGSEAMMRTGDNAGGLALVKRLREARGAAPLLLYRW